MAVAALGALVYTRGDVSKLVVMYSINVFLTFSLSNLAMARFWIRHRAEHSDWGKHLFAHVVALSLCATILVITILEKFVDGGWLTLLVTAVLVVACFAIKRHYGSVVRALRKLDSDLPSPPEVDAILSANSDQELNSNAPFEERHGLMEHHSARDPDTEKPVAILLVGGYSGLGRHSLLTLLRMFPHHFSGVVFLSVAVVDSESFKGADQLAALEERTRKNLLCYEHYARSLGLPAASMFSVGTEVAVEVEKSAARLAARYPRALFVAGQLIFEEDTFWNRVLPNETAFMVQKRLQRRGMPMIVVPVRIDLRARLPLRAPALAA
jgi:hypothetical protein